VLACVRNGVGKGLVNMPGEELVMPFVGVRAEGEVLEGGDSEVLLRLLESLLGSSISTS
jgi:hypothetical protein